MLHHMNSTFSDLRHRNIFFLPWEGSEPGSSRFHLFSHFHHFTAEPQRLPDIERLYQLARTPEAETLI
jgi:hypothetical protein